MCCCEEKINNIVNSFLAKKNRVNFQLLHALAVKKDKATNDDDDDDDDFLLMHDDHDDDHDEKKMMISIQHHNMIKMLLPVHRLLTRHCTNASRIQTQQKQHQHRQLLSWRVASAAAAVASCLVAAAALSLPVAVNCDYNRAEYHDDDDINDCSGGGGGGPTIIRSQGTTHLSLAPNPPHQDARIIASSPPLLNGKKIGNTSNISITAQPTIGTLLHNHNDDDDENQKRIIVCDYAIIGHGKAGSSAARTIQRLDPTATIVIIDPNNSIINNNIYDPTSGTRKSTTSCARHHHYLQSRANFIDHARKMIHVHPPMNRTMLSQQEKSNNESSSSSSSLLSSGSNVAANNNNNNSNIILVHYRKSALLATGSRGAPPPEGCVRDDARSRILELRSTSSNMALPTTAAAAAVRRTPHPPPPPRYSSSASSLETTSSSSSSMQQSTTTMLSSLPILDPLAVRSLSSIAASQGATIAVMGSGFEALELAAHCAHIMAAASASSRGARAKSLQPQQQQQQRVADERNHSHQVSNNKVKLLFGNSSPMNNLLPRYLGVAVTKRLRQNGIDVEDRTMTRYIAMNRPMTPSSSSSSGDDDGGADESANNNYNNNSSVEVHPRRRRSHPPPQLEIYTVKSYDHMDTQRIHADLLILAPSVDGLNGTAVVPTLSYYHGFVDENTIDATTATSSTVKTTDYLPWSSLISPPLVACYLDDGRVVTNAESLAASSLFAAGSVARHPNWRTGRAEISGGRHASSEHAGEVAARNMVGGGTADAGGTAAAPTCYVRESIPVWRSDRIPYLPAHSDDDGAVVGAHHRPSSSSSSTSTLALYSMGIHALCVGRCDSECMATHGFWWTNQSTIHDRGKRGVGRDDDDDDIGKSTLGPNAFMRRATRRMTNSSSKTKSSRGSLPVYGSGVVFYLDRSGSVEGVLLWGLPFAANPSDAHSALNSELVERLKTVIRSNGGVSVTDHSETILRNHPGMNMDVTLLSYLHLAEESKHLATLALKGTSQVDEIGRKGRANDSEQRSNSRVVLGRPLHRYTPIKPGELTNVGKMHRKDEAGHATEEDDVFYSSIASSTEGEAMHRRMVESGRPPSLKRIYPMQDMMPLAGSDRFSIGTTERERRKMRLERSRPSKEEPLWMRHGDEHRFVSKKDVLVDSFLRNITSGRFSDGSDAVKQAPVPKLYLNAKEKWNTWNTGAHNETEDD